MKTFETVSSTMGSQRDSVKFMARKLKPRSGAVNRDCWPGTSAARLM
jgi:hypothetical protein